jgi:hypothetical protein
MKRLPDYIKDCVTGISTQQRPVYYTFGNWRELCIDLADKAGSKTYQNLRYPLIFLHNDYREIINEFETKSIVNETKIYIICQSYIVGSPTKSENYSTQQRWDNIYKLILEPIYDDFIAYMKLGAIFVKPMNRIEHERKDLFKLFVGDNANRLPDNLDAIELTFSNLTYFLKKYN